MSTIYQSDSTEAPTPAESSLWEEVRDEIALLLCGASTLNLESAHAVIDKMATHRRSALRLVRELDESTEALVRELDVALNGPGGAARRASLCDIVSQVSREGIRSEKWRKATTL